MNKSVNTFNKACASIRVKYEYDLDKSLGQNMLALSNAKGYYSGRGQSSWVKRALTWAKSKDCVFLVMEVDEFGNCSKVEQVVNTIDRQDIVHCIEDFLSWYGSTGCREVTEYIILPYWASHGEIDLKELDKVPVPMSKAAQAAAVQAIIKQDSQPKTQQIKQQETSKMKTLFDKVVNTNKDAAVMAAQLTAGKTANDFIQSKLYASLPWYARLFAKRKDAKNNGLAKLATANIAVGLAQHFAKDDPRLKYISEAMLQDAMVCITRDSAMVEKFIAEVTEAVSVPSEILEKFEKGRE